MIINDKCEHLHLSSTRGANLFLGRSWVLLWTTLLVYYFKSRTNVSTLFVESCLGENRSSLSRSWTTVAWDCGTALVSSSRIASALAKSLALRASARAWLRSGEFELWSNHCSQSSSEFEHCDTRFEHTPSSVSKSNTVYEHELHSI